MQRVKSISKQIKIFIIAGEVSGDVLGAKIMHAMPQVNFIGVGGENMILEGLKSLFPMSDLAVMGIVEVVAHAKTLTDRIRETVNAIVAEKPDLILTVDSPGFAKTVVKKVKKIQPNIKCYHVVAPQVWAWKPKRAKKCAKLFDKLYAFFDFEVPYFTKYGLKTIAVGHPIVDGLPLHSRETQRDNSVLLIPGSRMSEVKRLLPVLHKTVDLLSSCGYIKYNYIIPTVETTKSYITKSVRSWKIQPQVIDSVDRYHYYSKAYVAIAASGTVSAELALMKIPTVVIYKMNPITMFLIKLVIRVKWVSLINILTQKTIFPELLGKQANPSIIMDVLTKLNLPSSRKQIFNELRKSEHLWNPLQCSPAKVIALDILSDFKNNF